MASAKSRVHNRKAEEGTSPKPMAGHTAYELRRHNASTAPIIAAPARHELGVLPLGNSPRKRYSAIYPIAPIIKA